MSRHHICNFTPNSRHILHRVCISNIRDCRTINFRISIYSEKALRIIANKHEVNFYSLGNLHFFSENKIGFFGTLFLKFKYAKHILYLCYFLISFFIKSKTFSDMEDLKTITKDFN